MREGVLLRHVEDGPAWWAEMARRSEKEPDGAGPVPLRIAAARH